jgi:hypothetical protein
MARREVSFVSELRQRGSKLTQPEVALQGAADLKK